MTLFQSLVFAILISLSNVLPLGPDAHSLLLTDLTGWPAPDGATLGAIYLGSLIALFVFFIHDWASMISSFLQVILFRKKPMTLDERLPFFLLLSSIPLIVAKELGAAERLDSRFQDPFGVAALLVILALPLALAQKLGRKNKTMFDWTIVETLWVGFAQLLALIPSGGRMLGALSAGLLRNFNREAALKYSLVAGLPWLIYLTIPLLSNHGIGGSGWSAWLTFGVTTGAAILVTTMALVGMTRSFQRNGTRGQIIYRVLVGVGAALAIWLKSRS